MANPSHYLEIPALLNWVEYSNLVWIKVFNMTTQESLFDERVEGRIINNCLVMPVIIPFDPTSNNQISLRFSMSGGALLGYTIVNTNDLKENQNKFYTLYSNNSSIVEIIRRNGKGRGESTKTRSISSFKRSSFQLKQSLPDLRKKYKEAESDLAGSVRQYVTSASKIDRLVVKMGEIKREIRARSTSKSKLEQLKHTINKDKMNFKELVDPYMGINLGKGGKRGSESRRSAQKESPSTSRSSHSQPSFKKNTISTVGENQSLSSEDRRFQSGYYC